MLHFGSFKGKFRRLSELDCAGIFVRKWLHRLIFDARENVRTRHGFAEIEVLM